MKRVILILLLTCVGGLFAQDFSSKIDTTEVLIGEKIHLQIRISSDKPLQIDYPTTNYKLSEPFEILEVQHDSITKDNKIIYKCSVYFTSFEEGDFSLKPIIIQVGDKKFGTKKFPITVNTPFINSPQIQDIKDIKKQSLSWWVILLMIIGIVLVLVGLFVLLKRIFKKKPLQSHKNKKFERKLTPYERAYERIEVLQEQKWMENGKAKKFYTELISIIRDFMGEIYTFPADKLLSMDFVAYIENKEWVTTKEASQIKDVFMASDMVKFAKLSPGIEKSWQHIEIVKELISEQKKRKEIEKLSHNG